MSSKAKDILKMDLYGLLGVESTATPKQIKKAYRQKALECHPDKNPDNPKAAELFHQLSQALDVLTDAAAKAAYDKSCAAKKRAEERDRQLDDKRKKFKMDLEARERQADAERQEELQATLREQEIARLREEGRMMVEEHNRKQTERWKEAQRQAKAPGADKNSRSNVTPVLKLKWKCKKDSETNGGYSQDVLLKLLQKYGDVLTVLISTKKKGLAIVEFATVKAAEMAANYERGLSENPLKISWQDGKPEATASQSQPGQFRSEREGSLINDKDYESLVLMRMRQAAERQKLTEQMQKEDEEDGES